MRKYQEILIGYQARGCRRRRAWWSDLMLWAGFMVMLLTAACYMSYQAGRVDGLLWR